MIYKVIRRMEEKPPQTEDVRVPESNREKMYAFRKLGFIPQIF